MVYLKADHLGTSDLLVVLERRKQLELFRMVTENMLTV